MGLLSVVFRLLKRLLGTFVVLSLLLVLLFRFVPVPFTPLMLIRNWEQYAADRPLKAKKKWVPLEKMSPALGKAVIAAEDQRFRSHWGFDFQSIGKAARHNRAGRGKQGASTITQQTAKNLFLWPARSWLRKGLEAWFTVLLEIFWSKDRILEVYLNIIETGDGLYGAEAAAQGYWRQSARQVSLPQAALLASALPNPRHWSPVAPNNYMRLRQAFILKSVAQMEREAAAARAAAATED